jgi:hypothetical protein
VGFQGGKIRLGGGEEFFDVLVNRGLVVFGGEQVISPGLEHQIASGFSLGVQSIQGDEAAFQIQALKELACDRDFIGLGIDNRAGQIVLAGYANGREHTLAVPVLGLFAVDGDQLVFGRWTA